MNRPPHRWQEGREPEALELATRPEWLAQKRKARKGSEKLPPVIHDGAWHKAMVSGAGLLRRKGFTEEAATAALIVQNGTYNGAPPPDSDEEIAELVADVYERYTAEDPLELQRTPAVDPQPLANVLETFRTWLYLPDPAPIYITCAVLAANRVASFDPTWLVLLGPAGSGKTEALNATLGLDRVYLVGTLTEAALLSGTPPKDTAAGASGGLLREIGAHGMIVLKDFGSILSMSHEPRARVLGALREIYDGNWHRDVGVDGGRRLHWEGRVGLLAGATTVLDQHHGVMAQLGERFLLHRIAVGNARKQGRKSLAHHGRERKMRDELADAVAGLFAGLSLEEPPPLTEADTVRLVDLAELVSRARSPVVRDSFRREIELVPDSEAPGRIVGALARTLTGLRLIGVEESEAWRLTTKTGLDSMPAGRLRAFEYLLTRGDKETTTTDVATELGLPNPTTHRTLSDLAAHGVVARESQGQGKPDRWRVEAWAAERYGAATTSSEKSGTPIYV
jgi:hypothetical protein